MIILDKKLPITIGIKNNTIQLILIRTKLVYLGSSSWISLRLDKKNSKSLLIKKNRISTTVEFFICINLVHSLRIILFCGEANSSPFEPKKKSSSAWKVS